MRKLINSAFLLLLTLFVVGKSWASCPNYNPNQLARDDFLTAYAYNLGQEIDTSYFVMKGILQAQNLLYMSNVSLPLICDNTMHDNTLMYYQCDSNFLDRQFFLKTPIKIVDKLKNYHVVIHEKLMNGERNYFMYGQINDPSRGYAKSCDMHIIDASNKIIYNLEIVSTGNKK